MKILAVDSTTEACSVALLDSEQPEALREVYELAPREHSQRLLPMVDQILEETNCTLSQLDTIAFGRGPGSFTGLRICLGLVQGLAYGADLPVVPVSSLQALAQTAFDKGLVDQEQPVIASIDARMDEVYWGAYRIQNGLMQAMQQEQLSSPEAFIKPQTISGYVAVGSGWQYRPRMNVDGLQHCDDQLLPRASAIARLAVEGYRQGQTCSADRAQPSYIRDQVAWKKVHEQ